VCGQRHGGSGGILSRYAGITGEERLRLVSVSDSEVLIVVVTRERATRSCSTTDGSGASRTTVDEVEATRALIDALIVSGGSSIIEHRRDRDTEKRKLIDCVAATTIRRQVAAIIVCYCEP